MAETSGPLVSSVVAGAVAVAASAVLGLADGGAEAEGVCDAAGVPAVVSGSAIWFQDVAGGAAYPTFVNRQMLASRPTMARIDAATMKTLRRRSMVTRRPIRSAASPEERWGRRGLLVLGRPYGISTSRLTRSASRAVWGMGETTWTISGWTTATPGTRGKRSPG